VAESRPDRPRFERAGALGWSDVPLDGLNCYLRCVEAVLRWHGHSREQVAAALCGPVDLLRCRRNGSQYDRHEVEWRIAADGGAHWGQLAETLAAGEPAIVMPDRFYWPGDELEGVDHFHDHTVLAFALDSSTLSVLDTDAPREHEYVRRIAVTPELRRACTRWAVVRPSGDDPAAGTAEFTAHVLEPSLALLSADHAELGAFGEEWRADGLERPLAHALHVAALGDFQPTLFLFAEGAARIEGADLDPVTEAGWRAARRAKSLGMLMLALHREDSPDAYALALRPFDSFLDAVAVLRDAIAARLGRQPPAPAEPTGAFAQRLSELAAYCFSEEAPSSYAPASTRTR
jgi:hypothetical protein